MKRILTALCLLTLLLLGGCATHHHGDGPPHFKVDASKIKNPVPRAEPLSRIGNRPSYIVRGQQYYVMQKRQHYTAIGVASWYGTLFHSHRTSNGERYDMLAMTAAHRNLPLPTYLRVTNLENGRQVIVRVNDRGPFKQGRLIDLSYAAALKLGMIGRGTALVEVKAIIPGLKQPTPLRRKTYATRNSIHHLHSRKRARL